VSASISPPVRLLLVDDVAEARAMVRVAVRVRGGFDVVGEAATGAEAVDLAQALRPDVVLLDLRLPDGDGAQLIGRLREAAPGVKIVVFSGAERDERAAAGRAAEGSVSKDGGVDALLDVLSSLVRAPSQRHTLELPADLASVTTARRFVQAALADLRAEDVLDAAYLVVSELAANAILHAGTDYRVVVSLRGDVVRVAVSDRGEGSPEPRRYDVTSESGRGLHLVSALAHAWGVDSADGDKTVWAELARA
jgi:DNA-binding NarL/FixJ family response regulator